MFSVTILPRTIRKMWLRSYVFLGVRRMPRECNAPLPGKLGTSLLAAESLRSPAEGKGNPGKGGWTGIRKRDKKRKRRTL